MEEKLNLTKPLDAWFGDTEVRVVKVAADNAQIVHEEELQPGAKGPLRFVWRMNDIEVDAELVSTAGSRSRLMLHSNGDLQNLVRESAQELRRAQEANAVGDRERNVVGDGTLTAASQGARLGRGYLAYELRDGKWKCRITKDAKQPAEGFTVFADESDEQIESLCKTFEDGDAEARKTMQIIAQITLQSK